jgi:four helix bundle protein
MELQNFRVYQLSCTLYRQCRGTKVPAHLRNQLDRASSSIALNIAEGWGRRTFADQRNFFTIAYGSAKEVQAILGLAGSATTTTLDTADHVAAILYKLSRLQKKA